MINLSDLPIVREPTENDHFLAKAMAPHVQPVPLNIARSEYLAAKMQPDTDLAWYLARVIRAGYIAESAIAARQNTAPKDFQAGPPERMGGYNKWGEPDNARIMGLNPQTFTETCQTIRDDKIQDVRQKHAKACWKVIKKESQGLKWARSKSARALVTQEAQRELQRLNNQTQAAISAIVREYNSIDITRR